MNSSPERTYIYGRFTTSKSLLSKIIRWACWSDFSHVELAIQRLDGSISGYVAAHPPLVSLEPPDYAKNCTQQLFRVQCTPEQREQVLLFALSQVGKPYDIQALFGILWHRDWGNASAWFCSELTFASFAAAKIYLLARITEDRITPQDLYDSPLIELVDKV